MTKVTKGKLVFVSPVIQISTRLGNKGPFMCKNSSSSKGAFKNKIQQTSLKTVKNQTLMLMLLSCAQALKWLHYICGMVQ